MRPLLLIQLAAFLVAVLGTMLPLATLLPLGDGPDEPTQIARVAGLLQGELAGRRLVVPHQVDRQPFTEAGYDVDPTLIAALLLPNVPIPPTPGPPIFVEASNTANYAPLLYLPAAAAIQLAQDLGLPPAARLHAARLANLLAYAAVATAAVALSACRLPLLALLALPMTLALAVCIGQDGLIIALAALAAAALGRPDSARPALYWTATLALAALILAKPPYIPLAAALLLPPGLRPRARIASLATATIPALLWSAYTLGTATVAFWRPPYAPGPLYHGPIALFRGTDPTAQFHILLTHPTLLVTLPIDTLLARWRDLLHPFGTLLSHIDLQLPQPLAIAWLATLALTPLLALPPRLGHRRPSIRTAAALAIPVATIIAVYLSQYLIWTDVGAPLIEGMQGRYLIPAVLFATLALPDTLPGPLQRRATTLPLILALLAPPFITHLLQTRYLAH